MLLWIFPRWAALILMAMVFGTTGSISPRPTSDDSALLHGASCALSASVGGPKFSGGSARRAALIPSTIEAMGQITEVTAFEYTTHTGESRVRMVFPMRGCTGDTQGHSEHSPALSAAEMNSAAGLGDIPDLISYASGLETRSSSLGDPSGHLLMDPDNPWFVLAFPQCGPPGANCGGVVPPPAGGYAYTTPPYLLSGPAATKPPNPDNPSTNRNHSNIMRHWANSSQSSPVQVIIACPVLAAAAGTSDIFNGGLSGGLSYTWASFVSDIVNTFAAFTGCPTANVWVNTMPVYTDTVLPGYSAAAAYAVYDLPGATAKPAPLSVFLGGQLIWDYNFTPTPVVEPNRNGPTGNGFNEILFLQNRPLGNGGFCSMDLDPATGAIIECDVAFDVSSYLPSAPSPGLPNETTAFRHEIGHFFGLDHTNLQPASSNYGTPSWMGFSTNPLNPIELSGMLGGIRRFPTVNMVGQALHTDDAAGLSRIYPVQVPNTALGKDCLINTTATIRGTVFKSSGTPRFGDNVFVLQRGFGATGPPAPPDTSYPRVGTISGTARLTPSDVVGAINSATGRPTSGGYEIIGIPAASPLPGALPPYGTVYDVIAEDLGFSLGGVAAPSYGEWYQETFLNPVVNAIGPLQNQTRFYASDYTLIAPGLPGPVTAWTSTQVVSSLRVVEGTVIDLGTILHAGGANRMVFDMTSRPLLHISPRTRPAAGGGFVTLTSASNYPLSLNSLSLTVNGIHFNLAALSPGSMSIAAPLITVTIPANLLLTPGVPARLVFTAREAVQPGANGVSFALGRNEVQY